MIENMNEVSKESETASRKGDEPTENLDEVAADFLCRSIHGQKPANYGHIRRSIKYLPT